MKKIDMRRSNGYNVEKIMRSERGAKAGFVKTDGKTAVIDYGAGNLCSVLNALERIGAAAYVAESPEKLDCAARIILPGVGAFGYAMRELTRKGFDVALKEKAAKGVPLMGICLGMQLLFEESEESSGVKGLCILKGKATKLKCDGKDCAPSPGTATEERQEKTKIPHIGWTDLYGCKGRLMAGVNDGDFVYFVHSYGVHGEGCEVTHAYYGEEFDAAAECGNVFATQFHPEKSGSVGERILRNFINV